MIRSVDDFAPADVEAGVGLALEDDQGRFVFFLAGKRHHCPPGQLFYAGIGGHREAGEAWLECAQREAREEIGVEVDIVSAATTHHVASDGTVTPVQLEDSPSPLALYEMIHLADAPRAGEIYRIVIYRAWLRQTPQAIPPDELQGVIALTREQVRHSLERKPTLATLLAEGGALLAGQVDTNTHVFPIGTAHALARIMGAAL
jgi:ADP-ribose pyrophosphatase YjhB (NUDIX family)